MMVLPRIHDETVINDDFVEVTITPTCSGDVPHCDGDVAVFVTNDCIFTKLQICLFISVLVFCRFCLFCYCPVCSHDVTAWCDDTFENVGRRR